MSLAKVKVPLVVVACIICLAIGAAGGMFGMTLFGYTVRPPRIEGSAPRQ